MSAGSAPGGSPGEGRAESRRLFHRPGDALRLVVGLEGGRVLGVRGEGPRRARCFVTGRAIRSFRLSPSPPRGAHVPAWSFPDPDVEDTLARVLGLDVPELPRELRRWRLRGSAGSVDGQAQRRWHPLGVGRGFLLTEWSGGGDLLVHRYPAPGPDYVVRPRVGLTEFAREQGLTREELGQHLARIDGGEPVNWEDSDGY